MTTDPPRFPAAAVQAGSSIVRAMGLMSAENGSRLVEPHAVSVQGVGSEMRIGICIAPAFFLDGFGDAGKRFRAITRVAAGRIDEVLVPSALG